QIVTLPHAPHARRRDRQPAPLQRLRDPHLAPGRLFDRQRHHRLFDLDRRAVLQDRFAAADLLQCQLAAFVVQLLEAVGAVAAIAHHLAGLADIAELLGQFQEPDLRSDDLLILGHSLISVSPEGGSRSRTGENRAPPPAPSRKPTTTVGLSSSYYISYNSCGNRHCPKCQAAAAKEWLADRQAELLPVPYFHVVFTLPGPIADIAYQNQAVVYDLLLKTAAETLITIAAAPNPRGARIGLTAVLHTWGSALTHHPHAHIIVPGGGVSPDGDSWIACRPRFFLSVQVLSRLFRRLFLESLTAAYQAGRLQFFTDQAALAQPAAFETFLAAMRKVEWVVYAKRPFGGPDAVLGYLSRYTHRTAIANSRLVAFDGERVTFKWKDYRAKADARYKLMTLDADEF